MSRRTLDLSDQFSQTVGRGKPTDFPLNLGPLFYGIEDGHRQR